MLMMTAPLSNNASLQSSRDKHSRRRQVRAEIHVKSDVKKTLYAVPRLEQRQFTARLGAEQSRRVMSD
jgi:hypothetical protein